MRKHPLVVRQTGSRDFHVSIAAEYRKADGTIDTDAAIEAIFGVRSQCLTRESAIELTRREAVQRPRTFDAEALTIEAVIASATPVRRRDARGEYLEVLDPAGLDLTTTRGASLLDSHQQAGLDNVLGTIDDVWVAGREVFARLRFSQRPEIASIVADIRAGIISGLSVGYEVTQWAEGKDASGQRTKTAKAWVIREASAVAVPADATARFRSINGDRAATNRAIRDLVHRAGAPLRLADDLIDRDVDIEAARSAVLQNVLDRGVSIRASGRDHNMLTLDNPEVAIRAQGEALFCRTSPATRPSDQARPFINMRISDHAREVLRRQGVPTMGMSDATLITRALSTSDFPLILADTVGRTLRIAYESPASGVRQLARPSTAADFRTKHRLMLDSVGMSLDEVDENGEYRSSGKLAEAGESYAIDSYGRIIGISRKALINDDLGAFTDLARRLGQASNAFEAQFLVNRIEANAGLGPTMSDNVPLFDATHGNVALSGAAPDVTPLSNARLAMRKQTGPSGGLIAVTPKFLLVPSDLETTGEKLLTAIEAVQVTDVNPFPGRLTLVVEPRLSDPKRWYVVADPAECEGLEYSHLAGAPGPQIETEVGFTTDGVRLKVRLDYGAAFVEWRSWFTNAGQ